MLLAIPYVSSTFGSAIYYRFVPRERARELMAQNPNITAVLLPAASRETHSEAA